MAVEDYMHIDIRVIKVTKFKLNTKFELRDHHHCCKLVFRVIFLLFFVADLNPFVDQNLVVDPDLEVDLVP